MADQAMVDQPKTAAALRAESNRKAKKALTDALHGLAALRSLEVALMTSGAGAVLHYTFPDGSQRTVSKKEIHDGFKLFGNTVRKIVSEQGKVSAATKRRQSPTSGKGQFRPIYAYPAFQTFLEVAGPKLGYAKAGDPKSGLLYDQLIEARSGYMLEASMNLLFWLYVHVNKLNDGTVIHSDEAFNAGFGGTVPATYYSRNGPYGKEDKMTLVKAAETYQDLGVHTGMNTYQVIEQNWYGQPKVPAAMKKVAVKDAQGNKTYRMEPAVHDRFDPDHFLAYFFKVFESLNSISYQDITGENNKAVIEHFDNPDVRARMVNEYHLINCANDEFRAVNKKKCVKEDDKKKKKDNSQ